MQVACPPLVRDSATVTFIQEALRLRRDRRAEAAPSDDTPHTPVSTYRSGFRGQSLQMRFISGAFWSLTGAIVSRGLTLLASVIVARLLHPAGFGKLGIIQSTVGLVGVFAGAGLGLTATKYVAEHRSTDTLKTGVYAALSLRIAVISGLVASAVLVATSGWIAGALLDQPGLGQELRISAVLVLFAAINGVQLGIVTGLEDFRTMALMNTIRGAVLFLTLSVGCYLYGLNGAVAGLAAAEALAAAVNQYALRRSCGKRAIPLRHRHMPRGELVALAHFAVPTLLASLVIAPASWVSNLIMFQQPAGARALGVFNAADRWRQLLLFLPGSLATIILPMLSNLRGARDSANFRRVLRLNLLANLVVVAILATVIIAAAPLAMSVFGADYRSGSTALIILSLCAIAMVLNHLLQSALISMGYAWRRVALDTLLAALLGLLSWWLIPRFQVEGMAWANLGAFSVVIVPLSWSVRRYLRQPRESY